MRSTLGLPSSLGQVGALHLGAEGKTGEGQNGYILETCWNGCGVTTWRGEAGGRASFASVGAGNLQSTPQVPSNPLFFRLLYRRAGEGPEDS